MSRHYKQLCFNLLKAMTSLYVILTAMKVSMAAAIPHLLGFWCGKTSINQLLLENKIVVEVVFQVLQIRVVKAILIVLPLINILHNVVVISRYIC